jgi:Rrf2 family transcriptional regulator, nitric oxide-sensitive transcriptional repressor
MSNAMKISEATSLALHTMVFLAGKPEETVSVNEIAAVLGISEAHLSKVLQRLSKADIVESNRGPKGGFRLMKNPEEIALIEIYEIIEGPLQHSNCLYNTKICNNDECIFHGLLGTMGKMFRDYLSNTKLSDVTNIYRREDNVGAKNSKN